MPTSWRCRLSRAGPRILALTWATWCAGTAVSYIDGPPPQLATVAAVLPIPLWWVWAIAAVLLAFGALVPPGAGERSKKVARTMRSTGMTVVSAFLAIWAFAFLHTDFDRGWVSAKQYIMLVIFALLASWFVGRETASVRAAREGS